jgi:hypothetical protein
VASWSWFNIKLKVGCRPLINLSFSLQRIPNDPESAGSEDRMDDNANSALVRNIFS